MKLSVSIVALCLSLSACGLPAALDDAPGVGADRAQLQARRKGGRLGFLSDPLPPSLNTSEFVSFSTYYWPERFLSYISSPSSGVGTSMFTFYQDIVWKLKSDGSGRYQVQTVEFGAERCLESEPSDILSSVRVRPCSTSAQQLWDFFEVLDGGYAMTADGGETCLTRTTLSLGIYRLSMEPCSGDPDAANRQVWMLNQAALMAIKVSVPGGTKCLAVEGSRTDSGAGIVQWDCTSARNQQWYAIKSIDGFEFRARHSMKCLEVAGTSLSNGARVQQATCTGAKNQRFSWGAPDSSLPAQIQPKHIAKCLQREGAASSANGAQIQQWACTGADNQKFLNARL